jgi:D-3-phosphoglycerate dehydrogenase
MSKYTILVSAPYMLLYLDRFRPVFERYDLDLLVPEVNERLEEDDILAHAGEFDGAICGDDRFTARVIEACLPRLKVIAKWGTGIDSIDSQAAARLGVQVRNTPNAFTQAVSDTVMGYILVFARDICALDKVMKSGQWEKAVSRTLAECTLGVVGVGNIGKAVLQRAQAFGMRLLGNDIVEIDPDFVQRVGVEMVPLEDLLQRADFISLNCDLNPTSRHLINQERLALVKLEAVLINTSRGPVIDEPALIEALQAEKLAGAGLDVFEDEPLPADSPLREMDNVLLAPHNANASPAAWEHVQWNTIRNLFEELGLPADELDPSEFEGE